MDEFSGTPIDNSRPLRFTLLAMMILLVSLLCLMMAGSFALRATHTPLETGQGLLAAGLLLAAHAYGILVWGLLRSKAWVRGFATALLVLLTVGGVLEIQREAILELGPVLVLMLAFLANLVVVMVLWGPAARPRT